MKFFLNLSVFILGIGNMIPAQSQIRTVQCYPVGSPFAEPVIELGSGQQLFFSFDDLSSETNSYTYKIVHYFLQKKFHYIYHIFLILFHF